MRFSYNYLSIPMCRATVFKFIILRYPCLKLLTFSMTKRHLDLALPPIAIVVRENEEGVKGEAPQWPLICTPTNIFYNEDMKRCKRNYLSPAYLIKPYFSSKLERLSQTGIYTLA
jgi:hypothetical protein